MSNYFILSTIFVLGVCLGAVYFGGLWATIVASSFVRNKGMLFAVSFLLRAAAVLSCFYLILDLGWGKVVLCLLGFILARNLAVGKVRQTSKGNGHGNNS